MIRRVLDVYYNGKLIEIRWKGEAKHKEEICEQFMAQLNGYIAAEREGRHEKESI